MSQRLEENYARGSLIEVSVEELLLRLGDNLQKMGEALLSGNRNAGKVQGADAACYILFLLEIHGCFEEPV